MHAPHISMQAYASIRARRTSICNIKHTCSKKRHRNTKDYTKPRQTIESPQKIIERHRILDKDPKYWTKPCNIKQEPKILNNSSNKYQFNTKY